MMSEHQCVDVKKLWCPGDATCAKVERSAPNSDLHPCLWAVRFPSLGNEIASWASLLDAQWTLEHFWIISGEKFVYLCSWNQRHTNLGQGDTILEAIQMALCKQEGLHPKEAPRGD